MEEAVAVLEVIIGSDDRVRIRNTTAAPWRRLCALRITFPSGRTYRGTGFLIGPRAVATAGHCVYLHSEGGWAQKVEVIPAASGPAAPYGSVVSSQLRSVGGWVNNRRPESDYGCIVLPTGAFGGKSLGSFGVGALSAQELVARPAVLAGFPGDKPFAEMWGMARKIKIVGAATLTYDIDTAGGQSGAPVYINRNGSRTVVGIHNYGSSGGNSATRVTPAVAQRLIAWSKL
ncbi:MAG: serine protease [Acidimicrobiia bacterium]